MFVGSIVIANELLGYLVKEEDGYSYIKDHKDRTYKVLTKCVIEVANPYAQALLTYNKLVSKIGV